MLAAIDPESSWERFLVALESDVGDIQGGTTKEGIHMGVMSGTLDLVQRAYLGTEIRDDVLRFDPRLTDRLDGLSFAMQFRGTPLRVALAGGELTVAALDRRLQPRRSGSASATTSASSRAGDRCTFRLGVAPSGERAGDVRQASEARSSTSTACSSTRRTSARGARRCAS